MDSKSEGREAILKENMMEPKREGRVSLGSEALNGARRHRATQQWFTLVKRNVSPLPMKWKEG